MDIQANPDMQLGVEFFTKAVENKNKSRDAGRPIYDDREFIRIRFPADSKRMLVAPANEMHYVSHAKAQMTYAERFPASYQAFKDGAEEYVQGTILDEMTSITAAKRAELRAMNVKTVEQLAGLSNDQIKKAGMGARALVEDAKAYLEAAKGAGAMAAMQKQIEDLKAQLAATQGATEPVSSGPDEFDGFSDEDLKNMIRDAGGSVPRGNAGRATLVGALREIAEQKETA